MKTGAAILAGVLLVVGCSDKPTSTESLNGVWIGSWANNSEIQFEISDSRQLEGAATGIVDGQEYSLSIYAMLDEYADICASGVNSEANWIRAPGDTVKYPLGISGRFSRNGFASGTVMIALPGGLKDCFWTARILTP